MWTASLTSREAEFTQHALRELETVTWARPLIKLLNERGGIKEVNKPLLFELRIAYEIHCAGAHAEYEYAAEVGNSTIDFRIHTAPEWLVELVSVQESQAAKSATVTVGPISQVTLLSGLDNRDTPSSEDGELLLLQQKIGEKVFNSGKAVKFPIPAGKIHLILADTRGFNLGLSDRYDYDLAAQGVSVLPHQVYWRFWNGKPIKGLFERDNPQRAAALMRERIHFIGFVRERKYYAGELQSLIYLAPNPHLFPDKAAVQIAYDSFLLKRQVLT